MIVSHGGILCDASLDGVGFNIFATWCEDWLECRNHIPRSTCHAHITTRRTSEQKALKEALIKSLALEMSTLKRPNFL